MESVRGQKTAVLEWNDHGDFLRFGKICTGRAEPKSRYRIQGVDYYPEANGGTLMRCLEGEYQQVLIDFGALEEPVYTELTRCHTVWIVISFCEWQTDRFLEFTEQEESAKKKSWQFLAAFGSEESRTEWNKRRKPKVLRIPFSADPFTVTGSIMRWLETI